MSDSLTASFEGRGARTQDRSAVDQAASWPLAVRFGVSLFMVAVATELGFVARDTVSAGNVSLIYVLPVVIAATGFGWGAALLTVVSSVLAYDFFFTQPYYSFFIASPADIWSAALLFVVAVLVSAVAGRARLRALEARRAAEQAQALQELARLIIQGAGEGEVVRAAAKSLNQIFLAPSVVFAEGPKGLVPAALAGDADIGEAERIAASEAVANSLSLRAGAYPNADSTFDFWPVTAQSGRRFVLGVDFGRAAEERPAEPGRTVELVGAYLAASRAA